MNMNAEAISHSDAMRSMDAAGTQYLTFMLAGEEYGVDILRVQEIKGWDKPTAIPNTPSYLEGVINLRGAVVPIIDLRQRFELERAQYDKTTVVIVLRVQGEKERTMGFVVDAVSDVYNVPTEAIRETPDFGVGVRTDFVKGIAMVNDRMLILLDIEQLVDDGARAPVDLAV